MSEPEEPLESESSSTKKAGRAWKRCRRCKQTVHADPNLLRYCTGCRICESKDLFPDENCKNGRWWCSRYRPCKSKERHCVLPAQLEEGEKTCTACKKTKKARESERRQESWNSSMERWLAVPSNKRKLYEAMMESDAAEYGEKAPLYTTENDSQLKRKKRRELIPSTAVSSSSSSGLPIEGRSKREKRPTKRVEDDSQSPPAEISAAAAAAAEKDADV